MLYSLMGHSRVNGLARLIRMVEYVSSTTEIIPGYVQSIVTALDSLV